MAKTYYVRFGSGDPRPNFGLSPTFLIFNNAGSAITPPSISAVTGATGFYSFTYGTTTPIVFLLDGATTGLSNNDRYVSGAIDPADRSDEYGTTLAAYGLTAIALGTTNVALGTTTVALGTTTVALGTTTIAFGVTLQSYWTGAGSTLAALGTTGVALGTTAIAYGVSNIALGTSNVALGTTILAGLVNQGSTLVAIGNTMIALATSLTIDTTLIGSTASSFGTNSADPVDLFGYMKRILENLEGNQSFTKISGALSIYSRGSSQLLTNKTVTNSSSMVIKT